MAQTRAGNNANVRQRRGKAEAARPADDAPVAVVEEVDSDEAAAIEKDNTDRKNRKRAAVEEEDGYSPWVDVLRVLSFLLLASCALSYLVSGGDSFTWGVKNYPKYLQPSWWKLQLAGPVYFTLDDLAKHDGRNESMPLYLAINGSVFDVSANRRMYGPGGNYNAFAGTDAARCFVTGCFKEDRTSDLRGAEEMFLPLDDPETDAHFAPEQLAYMRERERVDALARVDASLNHWIQFFSNNPKYPKVGYVLLEDGWLEKQPRRSLCEKAAKSRKKRKVPAKDAP